MSRLKENIRIKKIREDLGYTQEQFADFLEMSLSGYKKLESGDVNLTVDKLYMLNINLAYQPIIFYLMKRQSQAMCGWKSVNYLRLKNGTCL